LLSAMPSTGRISTYTVRRGFGVRFGSDPCRTIIFMLFIGSSHTDGECPSNRRLSAFMGALAPSAIRGAIDFGRALFIARNALTPVLCEEPFYLPPARTG
jgi:hypothetical protein